MQVEQIKWAQLCPSGEAFHIARIETPQGSNWNLHEHDFYECFWMEGGSGLQVTESHTFDLYPNQLWFVRPEHVHGFRVKSGSNLPRFVNLAIQAQLVAAFLKRHSDCVPLRVWSEGDPHPTCIDLSPGQAAELKKLFVSVAAGGRRTVDAEWFLCAMIRMLQSYDIDGFPANMPLWLKESLFLMRQPLHFKNGVARLVELCDRSPAHVARLMRSLTGKTPVQWIQGLRMHYAATLLQTTELSVTEIALEIGMENLSHFHKTFRETYGITPLRYRHKHMSGVIT